MSKYIDILLNYKGAIFAFIIMYVIIENTTKKDIMIRLTIIALTANESTELVQHLFNWGDSFEVLSQSIGVFSIWAFIGILKCIVVSKCRRDFINSFTDIIRVSKWGKK